METLVEVLANVLLSLAGPAATVGPLMFAIWRTAGDDRGSR